MTQNTGKRVEFKPPKGVVPEGLAPGDEFDLVCTFRVKPNGTVCLVVLGDTHMPGYGEDEAKESKGRAYGTEARMMTGAGESSPEES